jgi:signal transduction histidine kinase
MLPDKAQNISYIRLVTSLTYIDRQIIIIIAITGLIGVAIIIFVSISSSYFIKSIVIPIQDIGITAKKIAQGDFEMRLENSNDDEIGDLCQVINHMASELATSEKMKNEFISSISHELRTPLTAIRGWAETINTSGTKDQEILQKGMKVIMNETERLSDMVEELLDFSRMENGSMRLIVSKIDIVAELEDIIIMFEQRAKKENISILSKIPEECIPVIGDKNRLRQVFVNILDNALKYSSAGKKIVIAVNVWNDFVVIKIIDQGCGISSKDLPKIKDKFYKANYSKRGSGIGLAVADEIVRLHSGSLDIYSAEGEGTTVIIQIPIAKK